MRTAIRRCTRPCSESYRDRPITLLEIGLAVGGPETDQPAGREVTGAPSMRMWRRYFPKAQIHGLDISDFSAFQADGFTFHQADCGDAARLEEVAGVGAIFDIIIDDGSHASFHQQLTLAKLFKALKPGGLYVIEDMDWVPATYERTLPKTPRTARLLAGFLASGRFDACAVDAGALSDVAEQIDSVALFDADFLTASARFHNLKAGLPARGKALRMSRRLAGLGRPYGSNAKLAVIRKREPAKVVH